MSEHESQTKVKEVKSEKGHRLGKQERHKGSCISMRLKEERLNVKGWPVFFGLQ